CERDPRQENNLFGDSSARAVQEEHERRLTNWYIDTTVFRPRSGIRAVPRSSTALPSSSASRRWEPPRSLGTERFHGAGGRFARAGVARSEEHTSELQSLAYLVCRLLLEKKNMHT